MKCYCRDGFVVATHDDAQSVPPGAYGAGVVVVRVADDAVLEEAGGRILAPARDLDEAREQLVGEAWAEMQRRLEDASVTVATTAGSHAYGLDAVTQDNLAKAVIGVLIGTTPNPRPWTPRGGTVAIELTHAEVQAVAAAVGLGYEAHMQAYLAHKAAIRALTTAAAVDAYDITAGWPE